MKHLIVIVKVLEDDERNEPDKKRMEPTKYLKDTTKLLIAFFKEQLKFKDEEIIYFTEQDIKCLIELLDQSKVYKHYPLHLETKLKKYAESFLGRPSNASQLLTVYLNESSSQAVQDFVINRNPEFALTVVYKHYEHER